MPKPLFMNAAALVADPMADPFESLAAAFAAESRVRFGAVSAGEAAATERMAERARRLMEPFGNSKRCQILFYVERRPGLSIGDLTSLLACSVSVVSLYVAQLERQGWLRVTSAGRRRLVQVADPQRRQAIRALGQLVAGLSSAD